MNRLRNLLQRLELWFHYRRVSRAFRGTDQRWLRAKLLYCGVNRNPDTEAIRFDDFLIVAERNDFCAFYWALSIPPDASMTDVMERIVVALDSMTWRLRDDPRRDGYEQFRFRMEEWHSIADEYRFKTVATIFKKCVGLYGMEYCPLHLPK